MSNPHTPTPTTEVNLAQSETNGSSSTSFELSTGDEFANEALINEHATNEANQAHHATLLDDTAAGQLNLPEIPPAPLDDAPPELTPLREIRLQQARGVEEIAGALRLSQAQIHALEEQRWQALPGAAYVKGFLRNYTRVLGVESQPYIDQYIEQTTPANVAAAYTDSPSKVADTLTLASANKRHTANQQLSHSDTYKPASIVAANEVIKSDPSSLPAYGSEEKVSTAKQLFTPLLLMVCATAAFLLYWERAQWLPAIQPHLNKASDWIDKTMPSPAKSVPSLASQPTTTNAATVSGAAVPSDANNPDTLKPVTTPVAPSAPSSSSEPTPSSPVTLPVAEPNDGVKKPSSGVTRTLEFAVSKPVWLEVRDAQGNALYYGTKTSGSQLLKGASPLYLVIGAADAVNLKVDGQSLNLADKSQGNVAKFTIE